VSDTFIGTNRLRVSEAIRFRFRSVRSPSTSGAERCGYYAGVVQIAGCAREHGNECTGDDLCGAEPGRGAEGPGGVVAAGDGRGGRQGVGGRVAVHRGRVCEDRRSTPLLSISSPFVLHPISNMPIRCFYCQKDIAKADAKRCAQCMYAYLLCAHSRTPDARAPSGSSSIA
jgi:hypothetical protein